MTAIGDGINHPSAATLVADGLAGWLCYTGTPNSGKDFTAAQYADYKAHKLLTVMCYENTAHDIDGGAAAGTQHASTFLADARNKHVDFTDPALPAVDEHVTAADIPKAMAYQSAFRSGLKAGGWQGPIGIYGFSEVLEAAHALGNADFYFGAGSKSSLPPYTNIWQDNTQTIQVAGAADDKDWIQIPIGEPPVATANLTDADLTAIAHAVAAYKDPATGVDANQRWNNASNTLPAVQTLTVTITSDHTELLALADAVDKNLGGGITQEELTTAFKNAFPGWNVAITPETAA